jgi:hypothetical protein
MFLKKLVSLCLVSISFALTSINAISIPSSNCDISSNFNKKVTPFNARRCPSLRDTEIDDDAFSTSLSPASFPSPSKCDVSSDSDDEVNPSNDKGCPSLRDMEVDDNVLSSLSRTEKVYRIAIIGGGGAGSITAILLSNLAKQGKRYGLRFEITIFEKGDELITGSAFEIAAVLHAGGCEYPEDISTIVDCRTFGGLFEKMFPGLYDNLNPILYFTRTGSTLTSKMQQEAFTQARQATMESIGRSMTPAGEYSQRELVPEEVQYVFGDNVSGGVLSTKDKSMNIFERNTKIRNCIDRDLDITVKTNACVSGIVKNEDGTFCIMVDDKPVDQVDHAIITTWNNNQSILDASKSFYDLGFVAEDRVIALCDISDVPYLQNIPFFILEGGLMFMPVSSELGLVYRCIEGGSYPESGKTEIDPDDVIKHGKKILEELQTAGFSYEGRDPFQEVRLLGAKILSIVKESGRPSHQRPHVPPVVTSEDIIVGTPTKATYIPWLALQMIEKLLEQLSDSSGFSEDCLATMHRLFPDSLGLCAGETLPEIFTIQAKIGKEDIKNEKLKLFEKFKLTETGVAYQNKLHECSSLHRTPPATPCLSLQHPFFAEVDRIFAVAPSRFLEARKKDSLLSPISVASPRLSGSDNISPSDFVLPVPQSNSDSSLLSCSELLFSHTSSKSCSSMFKDFQERVEGKSWWNMSRTTCVTLRDKCNYPLQGVSKANCVVKTDDSLNTEQDNDAPQH